VKLRHVGPHDLLKESAVSSGLPTGTATIDF
jgi:hypothetical protein